MSYLPVMDTTILSKHLLRADDGRIWNLLELSWPGFTYDPGQFVMIQDQGEGFHWSYPYMVYGRTADGFEVLAAKDSSLFRLNAGDSLAVWGANGRGCLPEEHSVFLAEPSTYPLIAPLVRACASPKLILIGPESGLPKELRVPGMRPVLNGEAAAKLLSSDETSVYAALNLPVLDAVMCGVSDACKDRTTVFVSTRIGCGIGACRSCYLHSPDLHSGIPVCCDGPYLPYRAIDFEKDRKCFQTFR